MSVDLYNEFRQNDVSLVSFKYKKNSYRKHKTFLLNGRDIVLLDWKLNGDSGEEEALEVMRDAVSPRFHIPFCVVYTSEEQTKNVFDNILSFFIGASQEKCDDLRLELLLEDEPNFQEFLTQLSSIIHSGDFSDEVLSPFKTKFWEILSKDYFVCDAKVLPDKLLTCWCAYASLHKSKIDCSDISLSYKSEDNLLIIDDTFIVVLNKRTTPFLELQNKYSEIIANYENGFSHLLKLELSGLIKSRGVSLNTEMSSIKKDAYAYHKKQNKEEFENFVKSVILDGISLNLLDASLSLVQNLSIDDEILAPSDEELLKMNTFYNSSYRTAPKKLVFGDVFQLYDAEGLPTETYYVCINPLCDCAHPKNENTFYFAQGVKVTDNNKVLKRSEEVFVSYLPTNVIVRWTDKSSSKGEPIYITPIPLTVPKLEIRKDIIVAYQLQVHVSKKNKLSLHYITTLKSNYTQRIANHAFTHSTRVGISFVSKQ